MTAAEHSREGRTPFLRASWRDLIMVTWAVDSALLVPFLAHGTELDLWQGEALASIVAFDFRDTRVLGLRVPFHVRFPEVNLRFYVQRRMPDGAIRRGVTFIQEMVPRRGIVAIARTIYGEPYIVRPMRRIAAPDPDAHSPQRHAIPRTVQYQWKRDGQWEEVRATMQRAPQPLVPASIEEFVVEHYWGYTRRPGKPTMEYDLAHPRWQVDATAICAVNADLSTLYGEQFARVLCEPPISTFVAEGSPVAVYAGVPLPRHQS